MTIEECKNTMNNAEYKEASEFPSRDMVFTLESLERLSLLDRDADTFIVPDVNSADFERERLFVHKPEERSAIDYHRTNLILSHTNYAFGDMDTIHAVVDDMDEVETIVSEDRTILTEDRAILGEERTTEVQVSMPTRRFSTPTRRFSTPTRRASAAVLSPSRRLKNLLRGKKPFQKVGKKFKKMVARCKSPPALTLKQPVDEEEEASSHSLLKPVDAKDKFFAQLDPYDTESITSQISNSPPGTPLTSHRTRSSPDREPVSTRQAPKIDEEQKQVDEGVSEQPRVRVSSILDQSDSSVVLQKSNGTKRVFLKRVCCVSDGPSDIYSELVKKNSLFCADEDDDSDQDSVGFSSKLYDGSETAKLYDYSMRSYTYTEATDFTDMSAALTKETDYTETTYGSSTRATGVAGYTDYSNFKDVLSCLKIPRYSPSIANVVKLDKIIEAVKCDKITEAVKCNKITEAVKCDKITDAVKCDEIAETVKLDKIAEAESKCKAEIVEDLGIIAGFVVSDIKSCIDCLTSDVENNGKQSGINKGSKQHSTVTSEIVTFPFDEDENKLSGRKRTYKQFKLKPAAGKM